MDFVEWEAIKGIRWCWNSWPALNMLLMAVLEPNHLLPIRGPHGEPMVCACAVACDVETLTDRISETRGGSEGSPQMPSP
ncbi:hypothetical protein L3X38_011859 [Prunus dulcis]|uniref:Uncharacterized protein n=1 Tax=Prunus dulcis TaxID=3755 RepID=A0AAD4WL00_PRUDU|nr:hypothetical protein L3X38_011859 [Prunus dulcis]